MEKMVKSKLKTWACLLAVVAVLAFVGCGGAKQEVVGNSPCGCTVVSNTNSSQSSQTAEQQ